MTRARSAKPVRATNLTLPPDVRAVLDGLAAEDARTWGDSGANLTRSVSVLVMAERGRRDRALQAARESS